MGMVQDEEGRCGDGGIGGIGDKVEDGIEMSHLKQEDGDEDSSVQWWTYR